MTETPSDDAPPSQDGAGQGLPAAITAPVGPDPALLANRLILAELRHEALRAGMVDADGVRLLDLSSLRLSADATLPEASGLIAGLRAAKPWLFTRNTSSPAAPPSNVPQAPRRATDMTADEWRLARAELLRRR